MTRVLFVVPPFVGHVRPTVGVTDALRGQGHDVAWVGDPGVLDRVLPPGASVYPSDATFLPPRPSQLRGYAALKFLWEQILVPLAEAMVPDVRDAVRAFGPDILVVDQQAVAGALVAECLDRPWATSATTSSELVDPLGTMPKVRQWLTALLGDLRRRYGNPAAVHDLRFSPHLVLAFTTAELAGEVAGAVAGPVAFVGPSRPPRPSPPRPLAGRPEALAYVSLGTANADAGGRFLRECVAALAARPTLQAVVVDPDGAVAEPPGNVAVRRFVDQPAVLARAGVAVCHAGHNTVAEALASGVPLVVAPIRDDQPIVAEQVTRAGAGRRLRFDRADAAQIGAALDSVLADPAYRAAAGRIRDSFARAGGAPAAAAALVALSRVATATGR
jgi:MGT family glycosyltransferase